jgi:hypothetical protein
VTTSPNHHSAITTPPYQPITGSQSPNHPKPAKPVLNSHTHSTMEATPPFTIIKPIKTVHPFQPITMAATQSPLNHQSTAHKTQAAPVSLCVQRNRKEKKRKETVRRDERKKKAAG